MKTHKKQVQRLRTRVLSYAENARQGARKAAGPRKRHENIWSLWTSLFASFSQAEVSKRQKKQKVMILEGILSWQEKVVASQPPWRWLTGIVRVRLSWETVFCTERVDFI